MRRINVTLVGLAMLAAGCGSGNGGSAAEQSPAEASDSAPSLATAAGLEGTWRTGTVTEEDIEATLSEAGLEEYIQPLRELPAKNPPTESNVFILEVHDGSWNLYWESNGGAPEPLDYDAQYEVNGDTVMVSHEADHNVYRWSVDGQTLAIDWIETTYEPYKGIPEQVFQTAFYMSGEFEKQG